jgi:hypothetical protein
MPALRLDRRHRAARFALSACSGALLILSTGLFVLAGPGHTSAAGGASVWLQTMDSCKQALGGAGYRIVDSSGAYNATATTPSNGLQTVSSGSCPLQRGNCSTMSTGCVQFANLPYPDTFRIGEFVLPPANSGNPQGYAPCNGGSACRSEVVDLSIDATGHTSAVTTNVYPDDTTSKYPSSGSAAGTASDPIVFHDFGLGSGSCDGDGDADDHLTGTPSSHCAYYPESAEATACQPYPWSCTLGGPTPTPTPTPTPVPATRFALSTPSSAKAGSAFTETITAVGANNATATGYSGSKSLVWSGPAPAPSGTTPRYPTNPVSFSQGVASVSITLYDAQTTALSVSDGTLSGTSGSFSVAPGSAKSLKGSLAASPTAGSPFTVTLSALDSYLNVATSYNGNKTISWSGPSRAPNGTAPHYPSNPVRFNGGSAAASVTLYDAQTTALRFSDGTISGSTPSFTVAPGQPSLLNLSLPSTATFNQAVTASVSSFDAWGNAATNDNSSLLVSSSDLLATYPPTVSMSGGKASFSVTFRTPGQQTLTVSESGGPSSSRPISVQL